MQWWKRGQFDMTYQRIPCPECRSSVFTLQSVFARSLGAMSAQTGVLWPKLSPASPSEANAPHSSQFSWVLSWGFYYEIGASTSGGRDWYCCSKVYYMRRKEVKGLNTPTPIHCHVPCFFSVPLQRCPPRIWTLSTFSQLIPQKLCVLQKHPAACLAPLASDVPFLTYPNPSPTQVTRVTVPGRIWVWCSGPETAPGWRGSGSRPRRACDTA